VDKPSGKKMNMEFQDLKQAVLLALSEALDENLEESMRTLEATRASRDNETKSTAGDKYETGRAMAQIEIQKHEIQQDRILQQQQILVRIDAHKYSHKAEFGSLVQSNHAIYFLAIPFGKLRVGNRDIYAISLDAPIGLLLHDKAVGDEFQFQNKSMRILAVC
jgi:hypothetical protein